MLLCLTRSTVIIFICMGVRVCAQKNVWALGQDILRYNK